MDRKALFLALSLIGDSGGGGGGDYYTKEEMDEIISQLKQFEMKVVPSLPTTNIKPNCIYFVPREDPSGTDSYYEYIYVNNKWEFVGTTNVDLSNYWTIDETKQYVEDNQYVLPEATTETLGGIRLPSDGAVTLDEEGNIIISTTTDDDIESLFD